MLFYSQKSRELGIKLYVYIQEILDEIMYLFSCKRSSYLFNIIIVLFTSPPIVFEFCSEELLGWVLVFHL